jgi:hypothetical protein
MVGTNPNMSACIRGAMKVLGVSSGAALSYWRCASSSDLARLGWLVVTGGPGAGKTTLWEAGADSAQARRMPVLSARSSNAETRLSYVTLADLLEEVQPNS